MTGREAAAVLRSLAERVEKLPDEYYVGIPTLSVAPDDKAGLLACARLLGGKWDKVESPSLFSLRQDNLSVCVMRDRVCERIVEQVVEPAREAMTFAATPERTVERVSWRCPESLLLSE